MICELCKQNIATRKIKGINPYEDILNVCKVCYYYIRWSKLNTFADSLGLYLEPFPEWYEKKTGIALYTNKYNIICRIGVKK